MIKKVILTAATLTFVFFLTRGYFRYAVQTEMLIPITELTNFNYPENPADRSVYFGQYSGRSLNLRQIDSTHFDFEFKPQDSRTAQIIFKNIDVSLMTPNLPAWTRSDSGLERIALIDRQWNRQQISFEANSASIEVIGGDGFEKENLFSAEIAKNCLNAGLWEVLLFTQESGKKTLYYQGWFNFPLGHYKNLFELNTEISYLRYWHRLEHWQDPAGTNIDISKLRSVLSENKIKASYNPSEARLYEGEQARKSKITLTPQLHTWGDLIEGRKNIKFASFIPPGRYSINHPLGNKYDKLSSFEGAVFRTIKSPAHDKNLNEIELQFLDTNKKLSRLFISGFDLAEIPALAIHDYPKGVLMPMGIGIPPFFQSYTALLQNPPHTSPFFSFHLDENNNWLNHHEVAIDGSVLHRDDINSNLLHVYLLSYEREIIIAHYILDTNTLL